MDLAELDAAPVGQRFELMFTAAGEVRDVDGNLVDTVTVEKRVVLDADQARAYLTSGVLPE